jgi:CPA2 family monovalent cation:H+ antiporter-2
VTSAGCVRFIQGAVSGDASEPMALIQAHIQRARMLVIATPDTLERTDLRTVVKELYRRT